MANPVLTPLASTDIPSALAAEIPQGAQVVKLSPEQELQFSNPGAKIIGPRELDEDTLFDLADKQQFNPRTFAVSNPDALQDNELLTKLSRVNARLKDRGFKLRDVAATPDDPDPGILGGAWNIAKKAGTGAANLAKGAALNAANLLTIIPAAAEPLTSDIPAGAIVQKAYAETGAAMEAGIAGAIEGAQTAAQKVGQFLGFAPRHVDRPENEQLADFLTSVDKEKLREDRIHARGPVIQAIGGEVIKSLEEKGIGPESERIAEMAGADPLSLWMFGKVFSGAHKLNPSGLVRPVEDAAAFAAKKAVGWPTQIAGKATSMAAAPIQVLAPAVGTTGGLIKGAVVGGPGGAIIGAGAGAAGGKAIAKGAKAVRRAATTVKEFGAQVAGGSPLTSTAALGTRAVLDAFPTFLANTAAGAGIDLAFVAGMTELPDEAGQMPLLGTAFGAGKGALAGARRFAVSAKYSPDFWKHANTWAKPYTPDNSFSDLAALHAKTIEQAPDIQTARVNATENFLRSQNSDAPVYFINDEAGLASALENIYSRQGMPDAAEKAQFAAKQNGLFTENIVDDAGRVKRVVIAKNPDSVPHEGFHGIQAVLGESGNRPIDLLTFKAYEDVWEQEGREHVSRLVGKPVTNWRQELTNKIGEATAPDVYLARELAAENFDYLFRAGIDRPRGLPGKLADVILNLTDLFGTSPLARERTPVLEVEPRQELVERLRQVRTVAPERPALELQQTARAKEWVSKNPTGIPEKDAAINALADAITNEQGVTVLYWGAKGEPAGNIASIRPERRAQIEAQRKAANADRQLVSKVLFPYKVETTSKGPQFVGWSPDNFRANVEKFESWLGEAEAAKPGTAAQVPYQFDPASRQLTEAGRAALETDLRTFIANQRAGATGSGKPLVVPREVAARGYEQPERAGTITPLEQSKADVINYLFNIQIPETVSRVAPLHLAGQEISAATLPGRVSEPVRPRGEYAPEKLEKAGIAGPRRVLEVNPFRKWVEQTSKTTKVTRPSLIEVSQRLNAARIEQSAPVAERIPAFGGNVLTLASGFQPGIVSEIAKTIVSMPTETWSATVTNYKGKLGGGLTGWAFDLGSAARTLEDVMGLREAALELQTMSKEAVRASRESDEPVTAMNIAMELAGRAQAAREAFEAATGSNLEGTGPGSAVGFITQYLDPAYAPPVPPIKQTPGK